MVTKSGLSRQTKSLISPSLKRRHVAARSPFNTHPPVGRRGDPARSRPTTTNGFIPGYFHQQAYGAGRRLSTSPPGDSGIGHFIGLL